MFNQVDFEKCIRANLKDRQFGKKRADEIIDGFNTRVNFYEADGKSAVDASLLAMSDTFENMSKMTAEKAKRTAKMLSVQATNFERIQDALKVNIKVFAKEGDIGGSRGKAMAKAAMSLIEHDPRFKGGSYTGLKDVIRGQLFAVMDDVIDKAGKGVFGRQKGKAHLPNIIREVFGEETADLSAKQMAKGWLKTSDLGVDLFNEAGGSMAKLERYLPDPISSTAKLAGRNLKDVKKSKSIDAKKLKPEAYKRYRDIAVNHWDWNRMRWPDGTRIELKNREAVIEQVYRTKALDGANKIDATSFRGQGRALGNSIEQHRFVHYKNADGWLKAHEEFGDGNVFDVMTRHVEDMSHRVAMVEVFGPNPDLAANNVQAIVTSLAADLDDIEVKHAQAIMKNSFKPAMEIIARANPMDPESITGQLGVSLANLLTSAQLGSASLLAIPGDTMQTIAVRAHNKIPIFGGIDFYFKSLVGDRQFMDQIATQSGFVADDLISSVYATTRYTGVNTVGPAASRRASDLVMRASLMSGHTKSARRAIHLEFMGMMERDKGKAFADLPYVEMLKRYDISEADWKAMGTVKAHSPKKGVKFLRPIDALDSNLENKTEIYRKFQEMIVEEARSGVPEATISAAVTLRGTDKPDTLRGLIMHSFSMYKNFPVSFVTIYGRLGMTSPNVKGRLGFYAGLGVGMAMVGAMGVQMREVSKGRDPLPMDDPRFWGKAFMAGGALSLWGDFLFSGVNQFGSGPADLVGGPMAGFVGDTTTLAFGDAASWVQALSGDDVFEAKFPERFVNYMKKYTPGTSIWWARLALERQIWDRLEELADPKADRKRRRRMRKQKREYGNDYWWPQGEITPERSPQYEGKN